MCYESVTSLWMSYYSDVHDTHMTDSSQDSGSLVHMTSSLSPYAFILNFGHLKVPGGERVGVFMRGDHAGLACCHLSLSFLSLTLVNTSPALCMSTCSNFGSMPERKEIVMSASSTAWRSHNQQSFSCLEPRTFPIVEMRQKVRS